MIEKKIDICVGTDRLRCLQVRLSLMLVDSTNGSLISEQFHRATLAPGDSPSLLRTQLDAHLIAKNSIPGGPWPIIPDIEWSEVLGHVAIAHTPERIAEYQAMVSKQQQPLN